ncbi:hypothetical protein [Pseudomonas violetae]|uniref:Uncharacterized protein n=1 Tax=Pseudomonas violetae TaxID=2915813 RepID=A0ABT0ETD7_9PSED|nr:hypothetical protein [Pseudomonas violetae]MCK1789000.1 hypothetical protein [Pseudomonas violetae]
MSFIIFILCAVAAYQAYKRRSPLGFAGTGALLVLAWNYEPYGSLVENLLNAVLGYTLTLAVAAAVMGGGSYLYFKSKGQLRPKSGLFGRDDMSDMYLLVGRVLDTQTSSAVFSDTRLTRNAFGQLDTQTSHEVVVTHNTWVHDLTNDVDVNYSGSGTLKARPGHIVGTMSYKGRSFLDINFSTNNTYLVTPLTKSIILSAVIAIGLILLGWVVFPVFALVSPLVWSGHLKMAGNAGIWTKAVVPGSHRVEALMTYGGGIIYLLLMPIAFSVLWKMNATPPAYVTTIGVLFAVLVGLHQYVVRKVEPLHLALLDKGKAELNRLYKEAEVKHAARAAAAQAPIATPVM